MRFIAMLAWLAALANAASIKNTPHDLSAASATTGPRATVERDTCLFCHTSHRPASLSPLWNRPDSQLAFTFYSSDYLNNYLGLSKPTMAELAGSRTRLCLSCHDGVTALGAVYNISPQTIEVSGLMKAESVLGSDLSNDHPVLYDIKPGAGPPHEPGTDPEIRLPSEGDRVKAYGPTGRVECTSCHDPHDNQYGKFLVKSNAGAALCLSCHQKKGSSASAHANSFAPYTPPGAQPTTVAEWSCRTCHRMHNASSSQPYLLLSAEERTCYACHGTPALPGAKDIQALLAKPYRHPTDAVSGAHRNPEKQTGSLSDSTRHAECWDCHNSHQARSGLHTAGSDRIGAVLLGQWGVEPSYGSNPMTPASSYIGQEFASISGYKEYQLCFKCHSSYSFGDSPPAGLTDQSLEFNPNNPSYHNVGVKDTPGTASSSPPAPSSYLSPWTSSSRMTCSDCHGPESRALPQGPHGSLNPRLLKGPWNNQTGTRDNISGHLCFNCHSSSVYSAQAQDSAGATAFSADSGTKNLHREHADQGFGCRRCHTALPHGSARPRLMVFRSDPLPYSAGTTPELGIDSWMQNPRNYQKSSCGTASGCH